MSDQKPSRPATWDEIETGFHEYASELTKLELSLGTDGPTSYPPDYADWVVSMHAAREWLAAHDAQVKRDAWEEGAQYAAARPGYYPDENPYGSEEETP